MSPEAKKLIADARIIAAVRHFARLQAERIQWQHPNVGLSVIAERLFQQEMERRRKEADLDAAGVP
jgi:hypothetical protein